MEFMLQYLPLLLLVFLIVATKANHVKQMKNLSPEERDRLFDRFQKFRIVQLLMILGVIAPVIIIGNDLYRPANQILALLGVSGTVFLIWAVGGYFYLRRSLTEMNLPQPFIQSYLRDRMTLGLLLAYLIVTTGMKVFPLL